MIQIKFEEVNVGDIFYCYGDQHINYEYPAWCKCIKVSSNRAQEVDGVSFFVNASDLVSILNLNTL